MRPLPAALTALAVIYHRSGDLELKADPGPEGDRELKED